MAEKKQHIAKHVLFSILLILISVPVIHQMTRGEGEDGELAGDVVLATYQDFNWEAWFDQTYQKNTAKFLNEDFGYRPSIVRFHNQRLLEMYNMANAKGVVVGKDDYLYEKNYIKAHFGLDFIGADSIQRRVEMLRTIQNELAKKGKHLVVILAPGKASFFPEFIPDHYKPSKPLPTNLEHFVAEFDKQNINYLNFNAWFLSMKDKSKYPLYPKCGIHWSKFGEYLVADSLIRYIENTTDRQLPSLLYDTIQVEEKNKDGDYDIGEGMNLLFDLDTYPMAYPKYKFEVDSLGRGPKVLVVADSYYWGLFNKGMSRDCFNGGQFWYYNKGVFPDSYQKPLNVADLNTKEAVEKNDVIVLICTDANLYQFAFGFIDQLHDSYSGDK